MRSLKFAVSSTAILLSSISSAALAQSLNLAQVLNAPPVFSSVDEAGVDLVLGTVGSTPGPELTLGANSNLFQYATTSGNIAIPEGSTLSGYLSGATPVGVAGAVKVSVGSNSEVFTCYVTCTPNLGSGSTLTRDSGQWNWTYTNRNGDVAQFVTYWNTGAAMQPVMTSFVRANGEKLTTNLDLWVTYIQGYGPLYITRYNSVQSSHGYIVKFKHQSDDPQNGANIAAWGTTVSAKMYNSAIAACDPGATDCAAPPLEALSYSRTYPSPGVTLIEMVDQGGRTWRYKTQTISGCCTVLVAVKRPNSTVDNIVYAYGSDNRISTATIDGRVWTYNYTVTGNNITTVVTDPLGHSQTVIGDLGIGRAISVTDELNRTTSYAYDSNARMTRITYPEGNYVQYTFDARGNVTQADHVPKAGSGLSTITTRAIFSATCSNPKICNKPTSVTDAKLQTTDYTYDGDHGGVLTATLPAATPLGVRPQVRFTYAPIYAWYKDYTGALVQSSSPIYKLTASSICQTSATCSGTSDEIKQSIIYQAGSSNQGSNILPVSVSNGSGDGSLTSTNLMTYDDVGNVITNDGPLPGASDTVRYRYDDARRIVGAVSPDPDGVGPLKSRAVRLTYDMNGQETLFERGTVASQSDSDWVAMAVAERKSTLYGSDGNPVRVDVAGNGVTKSVTQFSYDGDGRIDCVAVRMNEATWNSLPASACTLATAGSAGPDRISRTTYDAADQVIQVSAGYGTADQAVENTSYNSNGTPATRTDAQGNKTTYEYDGVDRLVKTRYPVVAVGAGTSSATDYEQQVYDVNGNVTSRRLRDGTSIGYSYDALNRVTLKDLPGSEPDVAYGYDLLNRMTTASRAADGVTQTLTYDALGRVLSESQPFGWMSYQYDLAGNRTVQMWNDGFYVTYDHLVTGEVTAIRENGAMSGVGVLATYSYDDLGRRTGIARGNGTATSYGFDPVSRLSFLGQDLSGAAYDQSLGFSYNTAGQIAGVTRSNDAYSYGGSVNVDRAYTVNGLNQMTVVGGGSVGYDARGNLSSAGSNSYAFNSQNLLVSATGGASLHYDAFDRLSEYDTSVSTRFVYDGAHMATEVANPSGAVMRRYVFGPGDDEPIVWYEGAGTSDRRWLHADERGSIIAATNSSGVAIGVNSYDEYGVPASGNIGRFQYTGQAYLPELGVYYYKARIYSSRLGRFMQTDPIGYDDGMNWYNYAGGDPINASDPLGLATAPATASGGGVIPDIVVTGPRYLSEEVISVYPRLNPSFGPVPVVIAPGSETPDIIVTARKSKKNKRKMLPQSPKPLTPTWQSRAKDILCSDTTGDIADVVAGAITGGATNAAIKGANWAYAASVGGEIGSVVGRRVLLIAGGPELAITLGVAYLTSQIVKHERAQFCTVKK